MLICLEGIDACGKDTQAQQLVDALPGAETLHFPVYDSVTGKVLREIMQGEEIHPLLFQALMTLNRLEALPLLRKPGTLVLNRYWQSGVAYGAADGLDPEGLEALHSVLPVPDLCMLIDVPAEVSMLRRSSRDDAYETAERVTLARQHYLDLWARHRADPGWYVVDGTQSVEDVHQQIVELVGDKV